MIGQNDNKERDWIRPMTRGRGMASVDFLDSFFGIFEVIQGFPCVVFFGIP
jgi:hypothetical protein